MSPPVATVAGGSPPDRALLWVLRVGLAACFIGHGALGFYRQTGWVPYFGVVGIAPDTARALMPWVGVFDIALGVSALVWPLRPLVFYMVLWTGWTALLRPLAGESFWEAVERAGNYGVPLALFFLCRPGGTWPTAAVDPDGRRTRWFLRLTTCLLLLGHGMLGLWVRKPLLLAHYNSVGLPGAAIEPVVGAVECGLAAAVLVAPSRRLFAGILAWKIATELLSPVAGSPIWVFIEHGGSYAAPFALALLCAVPARTRASHPAAA